MGEEARGRERNMGRGRKVRTGGREGRGDYGEGRREKEREVLIFSNSRSPQNHLCNLINTKFTESFYKIYS